MWAGSNPCANSASSLREAAGKRPVQIRHCRVHGSMLKTFTSGTEGLRGMDTYLVLKTAHVLGVVLFVGNIIVTAV